MKKLMITFTILTAFIISSFGVVYADSGKNNNGQNKKQENSKQQAQSVKENGKDSKDKKDSNIGKNKDEKNKQTKPAVIITTFQAINMDKDKKEKEDKDKGQKTTPSAITTTTSAITTAQAIRTTPPAVNLTKDKKPLPAVIKIGNLQIPTNAVVQGMKASMTWDKSTNTITITKDGVVIKFVGDSKLYVNNVEVNIKTIKDGKGKLVPMNFIDKTLKKGNKIIKVTTPAVVTTTDQAINIK